MSAVHDACGMVPHVASPVSSDRNSRSRVPGTRQLAVEKVVSAGVGARAGACRRGGLHSAGSAVQQLRRLLWLAADPDLRDGPFLWLAGGYGHGTAWLPPIRRKRLGRQPSVKKRGGLVASGTAFSCARVPTSDLLSPKQLANPVSSLIALKRKTGRGPGPCRPICPLPSLSRKLFPSYRVLSIFPVL